MPSNLEFREEDTFTYTNDLGVTVTYHLMGGVHYENNGRSVTFDLTAGREESLVIYTIYTPLPPKWKETGETLTVKEFQDMKKHLVRAGLKLGVITAMAGEDEKPAYLKGASAA
jgi:hypothetical protein